MSLVINPVAQKYILAPLVSKTKKQMNNQHYNSKISFTSSKASSAISAQALSNTKRSLIASAKTRLGANYNPETNSLDFKLASDNAQDVILCIFDKPQGEDAKINIKMAKQPDSNIFETSVPIGVLTDGTKPVYYG